MHTRVRRYCDFDPGCRNALTVCSEHFLRPYDAEYCFQCPYLSGGGEGTHLLASLLRVQRRMAAISRLLHDVKLVAASPISL